MTRQTMPNRRRCITTDAEWDGHKISVTVGFYGDGSVGEVFANIAKGGQMQASIADASVLISLGLQHGIPPADLAKSLGRVPAWINGAESVAPASPVGTIISIIEGEA